MKEQKLKHVGPTERKVIALTTSSNRRAAANYQREMLRRKGRGACTWCGAQSCGHLWSKPGEEQPRGERCCDRCSHEPVKGWQHTHTAWDGNVPYPVCALVMREGDVAYMRRDGVVEFLEMRAPTPGAGIGGTQLDGVPTVSMLGQDAGIALYLAGEGDPEDVNLWANKRDLDVMWLPIRVQAAVARDEIRKRDIGEAVQRAADEWEAKEAARRAEEAAKLATSIEKRQLAHETVTVLRELEGQEPEVVDDEGDEDEARAAGSEPEAPAVEPSTEPVAKLSRAELKKPVPVKKVKGRPKRSKRQREARKRQKLAWARQEARQRLEVKRFERVGRAAGPGHDKGEA